MQEEVQVTDETENLRSGGLSNNEKKNTRNEETKSDKIMNHKVLNAVGEQTKSI